MSSLEEAYSIEYGGIVDPELAYDLYWAGLITDKSAFTCPSDLCNAKVTCVNIDKEKQDMYQSPHFRSYNHSEKCDALSGDNRDMYRDVNGHDTTNPAKSDDIPDIFYHVRPKNQFTKKVDSASKIIAPKKSVNRNQKSGEDGKLIGASKYYSVRSLVSKYIRYRKEGLLLDRKVDISGVERSYKSLFKGVYRQPIDRLANQKFIYWGIAYIDHYPRKKQYCIRFCETLKWYDQEIRPSFWVTQGMIDSYPVRNLIIKRLEGVSDLEDGRFFVFIYSSPYGVERNGVRYINFGMDSLDYLEIRSLSMFDDLIT